MSDASFGFLDPIRTYELGLGECREASHTAPGSSWTTAAYLRIQLQSDTVFPELFLDLQAEDGSYTMAFLPLVQPLVAGSARHCRLGPSLEARSVAGGSVCHWLHWRCQQPPPAQDATCTSRLFSLLVTHSL